MRPNRNTDLITTKQIVLNLSKLDQHGPSLLRAFSKKAQLENWGLDTIDAVIHEANSGDHEHLLYTLNLYCIPKKLKEVVHE